MLIIDGPRAGETYKSDKMTIHLKDGGDDTFIQYYKVYMMADLVEFSFWSINRNPTEYYIVRQLKDMATK